MGNKNTILFDILPMVNSARASAGLGKLTTEMKELDAFATEVGNKLQGFFSNLGITTGNISSFSQLQQIFQNLGVSIQQSGDSLNFMAQGANGLTSSIRLIIEEENKLKEVSQQTSGQRLSSSAQLEQHYQNVLASYKEVYALEEKGKTNTELYTLKSQKLEAYIGQLSNYLTIMQESFGVDQYGILLTDQAASADDRALAVIQRKYEAELQEIDAKHRLTMADNEEMSTLKLLEAGRKQEEAGVRAYISALQQLLTQEEQYQRLQLSGATEGEISAQERLVGYTREYVNALLQKVQGTEAYKNVETELILILEQHRAKLAQMESKQAYADQEASAREYLSTMNQVLSAEVQLSNMKQGGSTPQAIAAQQQYINLLRQKAAALKSNITDEKLLAEIEEKLAIAQAKANAQTQQGTVAIKKQQSLLGSLVASMKMVIKTALLYSIAYGSIYKVVEAVRSAIDTVKELDEAIVDLRIVTGGTQEEAERLLSTYNKMAQQLGATTTEVAEAAVEWQRQGYNLADTNKLIENSMILSKVGMLDSAEAQQYLTSAMKGYNVAVEDSLNIVDQLAAIDLNAAVSAGGLAEAMSRTANSANLAGVEMQQLLGYLAVVGEVTQKSMSSVGESFKTIFARFGQIKAGKFIDEETGEDLKFWVVAA